MKESSQDHFRMDFPAAIMFASFLPLIYILSVGPAVFLCCTFPSSEPYLSALYPDLQDLKGTPFYKPMRSYNDWWQAHSPKP